MARSPRLAFPGVALHIRQRGNNRNACFLCDRDRLTYLSYLRHLLIKYECEMHAYCLMTNHVHLLLTPPEATACGRLMRDLGRCYVRYFNRRHDRTGTLWEGRFRSSLVQSARYVIGLYRYIELNPVRAGMVGAPDHYPWSSHATNTGVRADPTLKPHCEFLALANGTGVHAAYRALFEHPLEDHMLRQIREATDGGYALVDEAFKSKHGVRTERAKPGPRVKRQ